MITRIVGGGQSPEMNPFENLQIMDMKVSGTYQNGPRQGQTSSDTGQTTWYHVVFVSVGVVAFQFLESSMERSWNPDNRNFMRTHFKKCFSGLKHWEN